MKHVITPAMRELLMAQAECARRLEAATQAVQQAEDLLDAVLIGGTDSSSARRVLHEAKRLQVAAQTTLANIGAEIERSAAAVIQQAASVRTSSAQAELDALLSRFTPSQKQETYDHANA